MSKLFSGRRSGGGCHGSQRLAGLGAWPARRLHLAVPDNGLDWCRVLLPLAGAMATIGWERTGTGIRPQAEDLPEGWSVQW